MPEQETRERDEKRLRELAVTMARVLDISLGEAVFAIRRALNEPPRPSPAVGGPKEDADE